ncbi:ferrochelatase [Woodsholea maritima]|uniref:ferrochelatase n=1 Tax=Woodsholea maritima TaxID=240237 RepID=UPI00035E1EF2|nr:ferrochelatase [Woodsholea maritima]
MGRKIAVVLFNLGGPDLPEDVQPFLQNLFRDPAIINLPGLIREPLAWIISKKRAPEAQVNYDKMGGGSPLLPETKKQADALKAQLQALSPDDEFQIIIAMRYWHPFVEEAVELVKEFEPDETVLLPLYPQFSTTTTGSSLTAWTKAGGGPARTICCYPQEGDFIKAHAELILKSWKAAGSPEGVRVLFSAHGLPEKIIEAGDPYQWQVERTVEAVRQYLPAFDDIEICYQSRVGPLKWIGPSTDECVIRASEAGRHILLVPIAFVSEHIETLVELDEEYYELAQEHKVLGYTRVPTLSVNAGYIKALSALTLEALEGDVGIKPPQGARLCPAHCTQCPAKLDPVA